MQTLRFRMLAQIQNRSEYPWKKKITLRDIVHVQKSSRQKV